MTSRRRIAGHLMSLLFLAATLTLLAGCTATVTMSSMVPAQVDLSSHRNLAVLSVEPYRFGIFDTPNAMVRDFSGSSPYMISSGFSRYMERDIAHHLTNEITDELDRSEYFNLLLPAVADREGTRLERFRVLGYDALLSVRITDLNVDEYQYAKEETVTTLPEGGVGEPTITKVLRHHVMQKVRYAVEFVIHDTSDGRILTSKTYSDSKEHSYRIEPGSATSRYAPSLYGWFTSSSDDFAQEFANLISPHWVTKRVSLMKNKPELQSVGEAYEAVKEGNPGVALSLFKRGWERHDHVPSGYNAAIILESLGQMEDAVNLMREVWRYSGNRSVRTRLLEMEEDWESHLKAQSQL